MPSQKKCAESCPKLNKKIGFTSFSFFQEEHKAEIAGWKQKNLELVEKLKAKALQAVVVFYFGRFVFFLDFFGR